VVEPAEAPPLTDKAQEEFLLHAEIVDYRYAAVGVTGSLVATLRRDGFVHDVHVQVIDQYKASYRMGSQTEMDFRDSWRGNVAAYRLDRLLGLRMTPVSVKRSYRGKLAAFTWWLDDALMDEKKRRETNTAVPDAETWDRERRMVRVFDQLIHNSDRNLGNLLFDKQWRLWMIDHTRSFKIFGDLTDPTELGDRCERDLLAGLRRLDRATLQAALAGVLGKGQIDGLLARRDKIVRYYEAHIAAVGAETLLYDLPPRAAGPAGGP
jgi:hypothetical protein